MGRLPMKPRLGRAEGEVLRYVADRHPISVREVAEHFAQLKGHTKTTTTKVMERLREKGFLTRELIEGLYQYSPSQPKARLMRDLVRDFVNDMLGGSLEPFAAYLAEKPPVREEELARLKETIALLDQDQEERETEEEEQ